VVARLSVVGRPSPFVILCLVGGASALVVGVAAATLSQPLLVPGVLAGAAFLLMAITSPLPAVVLFILLNFISQLSVVGPGVSVAKGAGGALVVGWIYRELSGRGDRSAFRANRRFVVLSAAFLMWAIASALWASDPGAAVSSTARIAQGPLLVVALVGLVKDEHGIHVLCATFVGGATLSAIVGLSGVTHADTSAVGDSRLTGGIGDPNYLAAILIPAVFLALFTSFGRAGLFRPFIAAAGLICLLALFLTQSRGGIVALAVTIVCVIAYAGRLRRRIVGAISGVLALGAIYLILIAPPHALGRLTQFTAGGGTGRTDLWKVARHAYDAHPIEGIGLGNFTIVEPTYAVTYQSDLPRADLVVTQRNVVHNTYLHIAAELGTVGIALFMALLWSILSSTRRAVAVATNRNLWRLELAGRGIHVGVIGMLTAFVFLTAQYEKQLWLTLALALAFARVVDARAPVDAMAESTTA
jgi:putative inorganic carbon (hco3(-)) transporter